MSEKKWRVLSWDEEWCCWRAVVVFDTLEEAHEYVEIHMKHEPKAIEALYNGEKDTICG